jgi:hypothetical protein
MKPYNVMGMVHPLYVLVAGVVGGFIAFWIYIWTFPIQNDSAGETFVHTGAFTAWFFLQFILFAVIAILIIPSWIIFYRLLQHIKNYGTVSFWKIIFSIFVSFVCLALTILAFDIYAINRPSPLVHPIPVWPLGLTERFQIIYVYASLAFMPLGFGMICINYIAAGMSKQIQSISKNEVKTIEFINEYLGLRRLLQILLLSTGFILSMLPLITAGLRKILIEIGAGSEANSPIEGAISYGLVFSLVLILVYSPAYINLANIGGELRDILYPVHSLDDLKDIMAKREQIDLLLQTNVGITQNLKAGVVTLAPLISGLVISLLGIKIGP